MNKRKLYESIMANVAKEVKKALNEAREITDVQRLKLIKPIIKTYVDEIIQRNRSRSEINMYDVWSDFYAQHDNYDVKTRSWDYKQYWKSADDFVYWCNLNRQAVLDLVKAPRQYTITVETHNLPGRSWDVKGPAVLEKIILAKPACPEFDKLNKLLVKCGCRPLDNEQVYSASTFGKRSSYDKIGCAYLMYDAKKCQAIMDWIKLNKKPGRTLIVSTRVKRDYGDRFNSYGEDMESEWEGYEKIYINLQFKSQTGRIVAETEF